MDMDSGIDMGIDISMDMDSGIDMGIDIGIDMIYYKNRNCLNIRTN